MATGTESVRARRAARRKRARRKQIGSIVVIAIGIALVAGGLALLRSRNETPQASLNYTQEDIATDQPYLAEHEMGAGPPIPFLPKDGPQPKIVVNERNYDFGSVGATEVVTREFVVANVGDAPLTISRAYTTCGCTTAEFSSLYIPAGKVSIVKLRFDAGFHDTRGQTVRRGIIIENNDPDWPSAEIWVQASVRSGP